MRRAVGVLRACGGRAGGVEGVVQSPPAGEGVELPRGDDAVGVGVDPLAEQREPGVYLAFQKEGSMSSATNGREVVLSPRAGRL